MSEIKYDAYLTGTIIRTARIEKNMTIEELGERPVGSKLMISLMNVLDLDENTFLENVINSQ